MDKYKRFALLLSLLVFSMPLRAFDDIHLRHINTKGYYIRSIYCDENGVMWFGTLSGLISLPQLESRSPRDYDRFFSDANNCIKDISGDGKGCLWLRTAMNESTLYFPQENFYLSSPERMLSDRGIDVLRGFFAGASRNGVSWICQENRLYLTCGRMSVADTLMLSSGTIRNVGCNDSLLAMVTEDCLVIADLEKRTLEKEIRLPDICRGALFKNLLVDRCGNVWLWRSSAVLKYENEKGSWDTGITAPSEISDVSVDDLGRIWVSTHDSGILIYGAEGKRLLHLRHSSIDPNGLQSDRIDRLYYEGVSKTMWIAYTKGGLSVWDVEYTDLRPTMIVNEQAAESLTDVLSFAPSAGGGMWVGLEDRGAYLLNGSTKEHVMNSGSAVTLYEGDDGSLWGGFYRNGLVRKTPDGKVHVFLKGSSPFAIAQDDDGFIWTALLGEGLWRLNPESGEAVKAEYAIPYGRDIECRGDKVYVAATDGCYVIGGSGPHKLYDGYVVDICLDRSGYLWLLGGEIRPGLAALSLSDGSVLDIPETLKSRPFMGMAQDSGGNLWAISSSTLFCIRHDPDEAGGLVTDEFDINPEGQQINYNNTAITIDDKGVLWIGTTTGYQRIDIEKLQGLSKQNSRAGRLYVGAISINDKVISPGQQVNGRVILDRDVVFARSLDLKYNENNLIVECSRCNSSARTSEAYYYQLRGLSSQWLPVKDGLIVLSNLPTGRFDLMIRTKSSDEDKLLQINVSPSFWKSWWATLVYLLLLGVSGSAIWIHYNNKRRYALRLRELQLQQDQENRINELKLQFFTNISHDLRTPLSLIIDPMEELIRQTDSAEHLSTLKMIRRNAEHLLALVNQILDFRRLEFGREKLMMSYGDVVTYVQDICSSFRLKAEKEGIRLMFIPLEERIDTMFDKDKTTKILMNLLSNAFKFTDRGGYIHVQVGLSDESFVVSVKDSGIGISEEDKQHIFDRFYQSNTDRLSTLGSGIGLHIVREYVRLQGGCISVCDNPDGPGAMFRFMIPLRRQQAVAEEEEPSADEHGAEHETTVLVVEDNRDMLNYISRSLSGEYDVVIAENGAQALDMLSKHDVDVIVSDIMMPEMDGLELCRRVKNDITSSHIPVILLTARSMSVDELAGLEAGADDYMTKPFSITILKQRVHNIIERTRHHHHRFATEVNVEPSEITITSLDEMFITKAISVVEKHMDEPDFSVEDFSAEMGIHRSQLYKKLLHLTGRKPLQFIRLLRLKRGRQLLEQSGMYVSEIAYKVGFNSPRIFSKYFKEEFGVTPKDFQNC